MAEPEHPSDLLVQADRLDREARKLVAQASDKRREAGVLRARAERLLTTTPGHPRARMEAPDPMLASAGLAIEDLGRFTLADLGQAIQIRKTDRLVKIIRALEAMDLVIDLGKDPETGQFRYKAVDPDESKVRDMARELGTFTREQMAEALGWPVQQLHHYVEEGQDRGWLAVDNGTMSYVKPGPERVITRRPRRAQPEKDRPAYTEARATGEPVRVVNHGKRGKLGSQPGVRHRLKQKDAAYERQQAAKEARAAEQRGKAKEQPAGPKKRRVRSAQT